jgi:hypothetical protein
MRPALEREGSAPVACCRLDHVHAGSGEQAGRHDMFAGLIVFVMTVLLLCVCVFMVVLRTPQCPTCRIPFQPVEETVRDLGMYGVETVTYYECSSCDRDMQRTFILTHVG